MAIREFLNVELPRIQQRRVDPLVSLADRSLLQIEFQSSALPDLPYRMLEYWWLIKRRFQKPLRQVVVFVGKSGRIRASLEEDGLRFRYEAIDLRDIDAEALMNTGNRGDLALAVLAGGGDKRLREILERAIQIKMKSTERDRLLLQILILSGLRGIAGKVKWELECMPVSGGLELRKIPFPWRQWREIEREIKARGRAEGKAEGKAEGMSILLRQQLETKFGRVPRWVELRLAHAKPTQLERWAKRVLRANSLEGVVVPRS